MPAVAPELVQDECIVVIDLASTTTLHVAYAVPEDDVEPDLEDIPLADTKTHQFFALRGELVPDGQGHLFFPVDAALDDGIAMPIWVTVDDVKRAAAARASAGTALPFSEADVPPDSTLEGNTALAGEYLRITADDARVPITMEQAALGFDWDLTGVPPGLYTVAGYIFSPPANGWSPAPGVVKLRDADVDPPAATFEAAGGLLFSYQGRPLSGCVDAPDGSSLAIDFHVVEHPEEGWLPIVADAPVEGGRFEHCFAAPAGVSGSARFRVTVTAPDGSVVRAYSSSTTTLIAGSGTCEASDTVCCDGVMPAAHGPDAGTDAGGAPFEPTAVAGGAAAGAAAGGAAPAGAAGAAGGAAADDGGCSVSGAGVQRTRSGGWLLAVLLLSLRRRRSD